MPHPRAGASLAAFILLLAACSSASESPTPEVSSSGTAYIEPHLAERRIPGRAERAAFELALEHAGHDPKAVRLWVANYGFSYLLGLNTSGKKIVDTIDVGSKGCLSPNSIKVDASQNLWIDCFNGPTPPGVGIGKTGVEQEYSADGSLRATYQFNGCRKSWTQCMAFSDDGGPDNHGHVFVDRSYGQYELGGHWYYINPGFYWWNAGRAKQKPHFVDLGGTHCSPICQVLFMDTDNSGNIWFTYSGVSGSAQFWGLAEVTNPTTKPKLVMIFGPGHYKLADGVFRSDGGNTLNVVDSGTQQVYQYRLPVTPASTPLRTLGPTPTGYSSGSYTLGWPQTGGFNKAGTKVAIGDADGWLDVGTAASNEWTAVLNLKLISGGTFGASYTPSDR